MGENRVTVRIGWEACMPRWWRLASPVAAILPVPAAIVAVELRLDPAGAAAWLLLAVLVATLVGGTAVGLVATVLTAYLFDVNIIEPGSALSLGPSALAGVAAV